MCFNRVSGEWKGEWKVGTVIIYEILHRPIEVEVEIKRDRDKHDNYKR